MIGFAVELGVDLVRRGQGKHLPDQVLPVKAKPVQDVLGFDIFRQSLYNIRSSGCLRAS